jgi:hypothetical protein
VIHLLQPLGFRLSLFLPADERNPSLLEVPPLPSQYHYEDECGTQVLYLAGVDQPCLADDEEEDEGDIGLRWKHYPVHASRFWLVPGGQDLATKRVQDALADAWALCWQDLHLVEAQAEAA